MPSGGPFSPEVRVGSASGFVGEAQIPGEVRVGQRLPKCFFAPFETASAIQPVGELEERVCHLIRP